MYIKLRERCKMSFVVWSMELNGEITEDKEIKLNI